MVFNELHLANSNWLWGLLAIPIICLLYLRFYNSTADNDQLTKFADKHLLKHLLKQTNNNQVSILRSLILWSIIWTLLMFALAGLRWDYKEVETFSPDKNLIIALDLSNSMELKDKKLSRIAIARQEIEDIINLNKGIKIGLIAFAADAHMVTPITDDMKTIRHLLGFLGSDLITIQGTRLTPALKLSESLLNSTQSNNKAILIISDGGFADQDEAKTLAKKLAKNNTTIHTLGIGTEKGADMQYTIGWDLKTINLKLEKKSLQDIAKAGNGKYFDSHYSDINSREILQQLDNKLNQEHEETAHKIRNWEERFYLFILPIMLIILFWFRKGFRFPIIILLLVASNGQVSQAAVKNNNNASLDFSPTSLIENTIPLDKLIYNEQEKAIKDIESKQNIEEAIKKFDDPYQKGVAEFKAGKYKEATKSFKKSLKKLENQELGSNTLEEISTNKTRSLYNLANSLIYEKKFKEAKSTLEEVLKADPNYENAKHNLEVLKKMMKIHELEEKLVKDKKQDKDGDKDDQSSKSSSSNNQNNTDPESSNNGDKGDNKDPNNNNNTDKDGDEEEKKGSIKNKDKSNEEKGDKDNDKDKDGNDQDDKSDDSKEQDVEKKQANSEAKEGDAENNNDDLQAENLEQDIDANKWLNRIENNPKQFLQSQFRIESQRNETQGGINPW
ncbi:MAG: VWA domain-containing protein [Rickettsiaceae bacterium]|nr:VWA domain-containing protein [Rickettsiaceae bacterium]